MVLLVPVGAGDQAVPVGQRRQQREPVVVVTGNDEGWTMKLRVDKTAGRRAAKRDREKNLSQTDEVVHARRQPQGKGKAGKDGRGVE